MDNTFILDISESNRMMSVEQQMNIYHLLYRVVLKKISGDVVELGCNEGWTAAIMQKTLDELKSKKKIYVYDSFEGLPDVLDEDQGDLGPVAFSKGVLKTNEKALIRKFKKFKLKLPVINRYWFKDIPKNKLPKSICFAHLDGDLYTSVKESLEKVYPLLSKGAIMIIDDYYHPKVHKKVEKSLNANRRNNNINKREYFLRDLFPGVKKACDEFFKNKKEDVDFLISGDKCHGYIVKK